MSDEEIVQPVLDVAVLREFVQVAGEGLGADSVAAVNEALDRILAERDELREDVEAISANHDRTRGLWATKLMEIEGQRDDLLEAQQQTDERLAKVEAERDSLRERCFRTEEISASWAGTAGRLERERDSLRRALEEIRDWNEGSGPFTGTHAAAAVAIADAALHPTPKTEEVADAEA